MRNSHSQEIEFWTIRERSGRRKPWELRWRINTAQKSKSFRTKALARNYESDLFRAARAGEAFSLATGEPVSWLRVTVSMLDAARGYLRGRWAQAPHNTRRTLRDNLVRLVAASIDDRAARTDPCPVSPRALRSALGRFALSFAVDSRAQTPQTRVKDAPAPQGQDAAALAWAARWSRPVGDFAALDAARVLLDRACMRLHGCGDPAADTVRRRRGILSAVLDHAVTLQALGANPLTGATDRRTRSADAVNPRTVPDWDQAGRLLSAIADSANPADQFLYAFFVAGYLAGTRPGETRAIRDRDIIWPEDITDPDAVEGWGTLVLSSSRTESGEQRGLKSQAAGTVRMVPLAPQAVAALRAHLARYGTAPDGRLFWHPTAEDSYAVLPGKVYRRTWARARRGALTDAEHGLNVAVRPYDLRHGCASLMIGDGIPTPEIARRLGHSVEVLLNTYTHWFKSQANDANRKLDQAFRNRGPLTGQRDPHTATPRKKPSSAA